jgi:hypothetical protein
MGDDPRSNNQSATPPTSKASRLLALSTSSSPGREVGGAVVGRKQSRQVDSCDGEYLFRVLSFSLLRDLICLCDGR